MLLLAEKKGWHMNKLLKELKKEERQLFWKLQKHWSARPASEGKPEVFGPTSALPLEVMEDDGNGGARPFSNSRDAFLCALHKGAIDGQLTEILYNIGQTRNGLKHCSVQVTHGYTGFSIDAYGKEADDLYQMVKKYSNKMTASPVIVI
jgi:hypothetical protein